MNGFAEATRVEKIADDRWGASIPEGWEQGRGAFGGLVVGTLIRALEKLEEPERPLRALSAEIPSPVLPGHAEIRLTTLRRGSGLSSHEAHLVQKDDAGEEVIVARASGVFGKARDVDLGWQPEPPGLPDWREATVLEGRALPPPFARHYRFRPTGPAPFAGGTEAVVEGWVELGRPPERIGAPELAGLIDAYWPSFFAKSRAPRPAATVAFMLHLTPAAARLDPSEPLFFRSRGHQVAEGYLFERRELWSPRGELVALNPQTFCIIR